MGKVFGVLAALAVIAFLAAYFASPVWTFQQLQEAARAGDRDRLEALIDFPAVRETLRRQVDSRATKLARGASGIGWLPLQAIGKLGELLGNKAVDKFVTPEAISMMVTEGETPRRRKRAKTAAGPEPAGERIHARYAYLTPDRFRVTVLPPGAEDLGIGFIMVRQGLLSWRVEAIELPGSKPSSKSSDEGASGDQP